MSLIEDSRPLDTSGLANKQPDESTNFPTKAQTSMAASGTEEESARHQVALVQNLLTFTP